MHPSVLEIEAAIANLERRPRRVPLSIKALGGDMHIELDEASAAPVRAALVCALKKLRARALLREQRTGSRSSTAA
jgi:hypothetical protein